MHVFGSRHGVGDRLGQRAPWYGWVTFILAVLLVGLIGVFLLRAVNAPTPPVMDNPPPMIFPAR